MKIVIPMGGSGERYIRAGYTNIKPLIEIDGKPIIEHVVNIFPEEDDFVFICNNKHLETTNLREVLSSLKPNAKIIPIAPHKLGPVHTVLQALDAIDDDEPVTINYCDFSVYWDYKDFKSTVKANGCDGCVTAYKGFHPHLLSEGFYAGMRTDKSNNMLEIKEKYSFTKNKMDSYQSSGTYYFGKGSYVKQYFNEIVARDMSINGEYYISMVYKLMKDAKLDIHVYELEHFLQWGTPQDLEEYKYWSDYFRAKNEAGELI